MSVISTVIIQKVGFSAGYCDLNIKETCGHGGYELMLEHNVVLHTKVHDFDAKIY